MKNVSKAKKGIIAVVVSVLLMCIIGISESVVSNSFKNESKTFNTEFGNGALIEEIKTSEVHYIDKSLINVQLSVPYEVLPAEAGNNSVYMISSDNETLVVNDDNTVTALKEGEVTLTFVADDGSNVTTDLKIVIE